MALLISFAAAQSTEKCRLHFYQLSVNFASLLFALCIFYFPLYQLKSLFQIIHKGNKLLPWGDPSLNALLRFLRPWPHLSSSSSWVDSGTCRETKTRINVFVEKPTQKLCPCSNDLGILEPSSRYWEGVERVIVTQMWQEMAQGGWEQRSWPRPVRSWQSYRALNREERNPCGIISAQMSGRSPSPQGRRWAASQEWTHPAVGWAFLSLGPVGTGWGVWNLCKR